MSETSPIIEADTQVSQSEIKVSETKPTNYILIGIFVIVLIVLFYYAAKKFTENKEPSGMVDKPEARRKKTTDDTVIDFNLRESIEELRDLQKKTVKTLSDTFDL